ncbi:hypothetical protein AWU68_2148 [Corynebacterium simulans]|uniref:Uncharacterized protein n=1 Tax=Corynebacterium accolens TaxID=38284 RepID=A0A2A4AKM6_9CORY|nr:MULTISPECIES: hypothetical protein [Corynebacterium]MDU3176233.1 hypothetical protein [Corynebacterium striatum]PCC82746.1 hypothetical protein COM45_07975 [Corynebacterium accolens]AMO89857.1 hypothetical protein WM42_2157 [Corynebacterium simulans]AMO92395.1 hypothetical protein AWU68_2148 [Corynebacterium simulans]MCK6161907.1 hypothetical protein [Corynebacterium simulans]
MFPSLGDAHHFINKLIANILHDDDALDLGLLSRLGDIGGIETYVRIGAAELQQGLLEVAADEISVMKAWTCSKRVGHRKSVYNHVLDLNAPL